MLTSEDILSQRGKTLKRIDNNLYRFGRKIRLGDVWRCVRKMCKAKVLICGDSIIPKNILHNHSKSYKPLKDENFDQKKYENSSNSYLTETSDDVVDDDDDDLNTSQEETEYDCTKKLPQFEELGNKKTFSDKATNTEKSVQSIGVNTIESSFTSNKPSRNKFKKTRYLNNSQNNLPQKNFNLDEPDESFNKSESFKSSANQNLLYFSAKDSSCSDIMDS